MATLPPAPLIDAAAVRVRDAGRPDWVTAMGGDFMPPAPATDGEIAELLGVSKRRVQRWRHGQLLRDVDADVLAVRLGMHPAELWPEFAGLGWSLVDANPPPR